MSQHRADAQSPATTARAGHRRHDLRPVRALAVLLTAAAVATGTWLLGDDADGGSGGSPRPALLAPTGSAPPLAVAPPPAGASRPGDHVAPDSAGQRHRTKPHGSD